MYRIVFRQGTAQFDDAKAIRTGVFVTEQGFQNEFDEIDTRAYHAVLYDGERPVATGRVFQEPEGVWHIGRVAVRKEYRGAGMGALVMRALEEKLRELHAPGAELSAQIQAAGFYEKLGYRPFGPEYWDEHVPHIAMRKKFTNDL